MRLSKFLSIISCVTFLSLFYVYQQTEIFRLAYVGQKKIVCFTDLLDKNNILRYNIGRKASLVRIGDKISSSSDFQMPDSYRLVRLVPAKEGIKIKGQPLKTLASRIFGVKRQAEAKTINP